MNTIENTWRLVPVDAAQHELAEVRAALGFLPQGYAAMAGLDRLADLLAASNCPENTAINQDECDPQVYERGISVGLFAIPKEDANAICAGIAAATGASVDWHYIAGRVHIKALPAATPVSGDARDASLYRWLKTNIQPGYELPGGFYIDDEDTESWDRTIEAAQHQGDA